MSAAEIPLDFHHRDDAGVAARAAEFRAMMVTRRTVRHFCDRPVPRAVIEDAIRVAGSAPSGANKQPWHFCVIASAEAKRKVRLAAEAEERAFYEGRAPKDWLDDLAPLGTDASKPFLETAPVLIAVFAERHGEGADGARTKNYYVPESVGIAMGFLIAALHYAGLATLTHTPSPMAFLTELCGRPARESPKVLLVAGYPAPDATVPVAATHKKPLAQICDWR
ncbi:MAG: nitroreductase family protein [Pseudomonadota bacterium]